MKQVTYKGLTFVPYLDREKIQNRVKELGSRITEENKGRRPLFLCVLNGAFAFASDLFRSVDLPDAEISFIRLKSYEGTSSTGVVKEVIGLHEDIKDRTVIVVEDIVDTGHTITRLVKDLKAKDPVDYAVGRQLTEHLREHFFRNRRDVSVQFIKAHRLALGDLHENHECPLVAEPFEHRSRLAIFVV